MCFVVASFCFALGMKETYEKVLLAKACKASGVPLPTKPRLATALRTLFTITLFRPLRMFVVEPIVLFLSLYVAFNFGVIFAFFDAFPMVFSEVYKFDLGQIGLTFLGLGVGCLVAVPSFILVDRMTYHKMHVSALTKDFTSKIAPEHRLYSAMLGAVGLPIGLFWFAWTAKESVHWISPVLAAAPFGFGNLMVFVSISRHGTSEPY